MYNFITVCVGPRYGPEYPNATFNMVKRHFHEPFNFYCVTDHERRMGDPCRLNTDIEIIRPTHDLTGWWNKMYLFSPLMPEGRLIYLDLDVVIMNDITDLITSYQGEYCGDEDHIHYGEGIFGSGKAHPQFGPIDCSLGTALVSMKAHHHPWVWEKYLARRQEVEKVFHRHGDQVFTSWALNGRFDLWEQLYPETHGFCSYRFDIVQKKQDPLKQRFINFHGNPKPHEAVKSDAWLKEHWK